MRIECSTCYYSDDPTGRGHCYMFRETPAMVFKKGYCLSYTENGSIDFVDESEETTKGWTGEEENC